MPIVRKARTRPRKTPKQERSRDTVDVILEAAARVLVRLGYARATTNRIADAAGISVGSLYQYFPSKDAIAVELLRRYRERLVALLRGQMASVAEASLESMVRTLVTALLRAEGIDPALHRVLIEQVLRTSARAEMLGFEERIEALLAEALRASPGIMSAKNPEVAAFVLVRAVLGAVHAAVVDRPGVNGPELVEEITRMIVRYLSP
jgi:AcrR family transcriptional regulator